MKFAPLLLALCTVATTSVAQQVTYDSVRLSELFLEYTWAAHESSVPLLISGLETQLRQTGIPDQPAAAFSRALKKSFTRDNMGKALSVFLAQSLTVDETRDLLAFLQSTLGRKYLTLSRDLASSPLVISQIIKQACEASSKELDKREFKSLSAVCPSAA